jgi:hypothetical protein
MTPTNFFAAILTLSTTLYGFASHSITMTQYEKKAAIFLLHKDLAVQKFQRQELPNPGHICYPKVSAECIDFVAGSLPNTDERLEAARACVGNLNADCASFAAGTLSNISDRIEAAKACRGNFGKDCLEYVSGTFADMSQRLQSAKACNGADLECVKYVAGSFPSSDERISAAKACGGQ